MIVYLAHPLNAETREGIEANRDNPARWGAWFVLHFDVAISADWIWMTGALEETPENRRRGLETDLAHVERCDAFWMVGGRRSSGMSAEFNHAVDCRKPWLDLTEFGWEAPVQDTDRTRAIYRAVCEWFRAEQERSLKEHSFHA